MDTSDIPDDWPTDGVRHAFEAEYTNRPPSIAIVETIAAIEGSRATDVDFSLYESVDPDALDTLFADPESEDETADFTAELLINDYVVRVRTDGTIRVGTADRLE